MAKVKQVSLCPRCEGELPAGDPTQCPSCNMFLRAPEGNVFDSPQYLYFQTAELKEQIQQEFSKNETKANQQSIRLTQQQLQWLRTCKDEDRVAALTDALWVMQNVILSNSSTDTTKALTGIGKRIGEIAQSIEAYVSKGGKLNGTRISTATAPSGRGEGDEPA